MNNLYLIYAEVLDGDGNYPTALYIAAKTKKLAEPAAKNLLESKNRSGKVLIKRIEKLGPVYLTELSNA